METIKCLIYELPPMV